MRIHTFTVIDIESGRIISDESYEYSGPLALFDRSLQQDAENAANTAKTTGANYGSSASGISAQLVPQLQREATGNVGLSPTQANNELVAGEQGAGGATAGVTGAAGLNAMRTRNSGALSGVLDQAARSKGQTLSNNALGVQKQSTDIARQNQERSQQMLSGLYGTDVGAQMHSMGLEAPDINAGVNAGNSGWFQDATQLINALGGKAAQAGAMAGGG